MSWILTTTGRQHQLAGAGASTQDNVPGLTKTAQVRMCGNSVCPPLSCAIARANYSEITIERMVA